MPGIGSFGRAMIPLGSAAGVGLNAYNTQVRQNLQNQMDVQQMQINQQRAKLAERQQDMEDAELRFNMQMEKQNYQNQRGAEAAIAQMCTRMGMNATDKNEQMFWDQAANMALDHATPEQILAFAKAAGFDQEAKQALWAAQAYRAGAAADLDETLARGLSKMPGFGGGGSMRPVTGPYGGSFGGGPSGATAPPGTTRVGTTSEPDGPIPGMPGYMRKGGIIYKAVGFTGGGGGSAGAPATGYGGTVIPPGVPSSPFPPRMTPPGGFGGP